MPQPQTQELQDPFGSYSAEERALIRLQLLRLQGSGQLNEAQQKGVGNALRFLAPRPTQPPPVRSRWQRATEFSLGGLVEPKTIESKLARAFTGETPEQLAQAEQQAVATGDAGEAAKTALSRGVAESTGRVLSSFTSPLNIGLMVVGGVATGARMLYGLRAAQAAQAANALTELRVAGAAAPELVLAEAEATSLLASATRLKTTADVFRAGEAAAGTTFSAEGAVQLAYGKTLEEKLLGASQLVTGGAMALHGARALPIPPELPSAPVPKRVIRGYFPLPRGVELTTDILRSVNEPFLRVSRAEQITTIERIEPGDIIVSRLPDGDMAVVQAQTQLGHLAYIVPDKIFRPTVNQVRAARQLGSTATVIPRAVLDAVEREAGSRLIRQYLSSQAEAPPGAISQPGVVRVSPEVAELTLGRLVRLTKSKTFEKLAPSVQSAVTNEITRLKGEGVRPAKEVIETPRFVRATVKEESANLTEWHPEAQRVSEISPVEYLQRVGGAKQISRQKVDALKERMRRGLPIDPVWLDADTQGRVIRQEGRHRAVAAKELGITKIPLIEWIRDKRGNYVDVRATQALPVSTEPARSEPELTALKRADELAKLYSKAQQSGQTASKVGLGGVWEALSKGPLEPGVPGILAGAKKLAKAAVQGRLPIVPGLPAIETIRAQGKAGAALADVVLRTRREGDIFGGSLVADYRQNTIGLSASEFDNFVDALRGRAQPKNQRVAQTVAAERARLDDVMKMAQKAGVEEVVFDEEKKSFTREPVQHRADYFPLKFPLELLQGRLAIVAPGRTIALPDIFQRLVENGTAKNVAEAEAIWNRYIRPHSERLAGNLQRQRTSNLEEFGRKDRAVLKEYYEQVAHKIVEVKNLGTKAKNAVHPELVAELLEEIRKEGGDHRFSRAVVDAYFGLDPLSSVERDLWGTVSSAQAATKLSRAVIGNLSQPVFLSMIGQGGTLRLLRAATKVAADYKGSAEFGLRSGAILESLLAESRRSIGVAPESFGGRVMRYTGFTFQERLNRIVGAVVGREFAKDMFKVLQNNPGNQLARRGLERWAGLDPDQVLVQGQLTEADLLMAGKVMADSTQFRSGVLDLPFGWQNSMAGKMLTLYKQFTYNQARLIKRAVLDEMAQGNFRPLIPLAATVGAVGEIFGSLRSAVTGRERPTELEDRILDNYAQVGAFGIVADTIVGGSFGKGLSQVAGPVAGDVGTAIDVGAMTLKEPARGFEMAAEETVKRAVPVVGLRVARALKEQAKEQKESEQRRERTPRRRVPRSR